MVNQHQLEYELELLRWIAKDLTNIQGIIHTLVKSNSEYVDYDLGKSITNEQHKVIDLITLCLTKMADRDLKKPTE